MDALPTPAEIERRAKALGLGMPDVCRAAGIAPSTFYRWRAGDTCPSLDVCQRLLDATRPRGIAPLQGAA